MINPGFWAGSCLSSRFLGCFTVQYNHVWNSRNWRRGYFWFEQSNNADLGCPIKSPFELGFCYFAQSWVWTQILTKKNDRPFWALLGGPSIFRKAKEILKNTKENRYWFCFGHNFLTMSAFNLFPWQVIYIFYSVNRHPTWP